MDVVLSQLERWFQLGGQGWREGGREGGRVGGWVGLHYPGRPITSKVWHCDLLQHHLHDLASLQTVFRALAFSGGRGCRSVLSPFLTAETEWRCNMWLTSRLTQCLITTPATIILCHIILSPTIASHTFQFTR